MTDEDNMHFSTAKDEKCDEKEEKRALNVKLGVSVLQWLNYGESPKYASFHEEVIGNPESVGKALYLKYYVKKCFVKMISRKWDQWTLTELLSLKLYTDTDEYQSSFRKASWQSTPKDIKRTFYQWAVQLHKAALFHAKPTPRWTSSPQRLFHGMFQMLVMERWFGSTL